MPKRAPDPARDSEGGELLTLSEVARRTEISMPTLLRYKKEHQARIPSVGHGRQQRYPPAALAVFQAIKDEGLARRGRGKGGARGAGPRRKTGAATAPRGRRAAAAGPNAGGLLSLKEIGRRTGISYPTLIRYVKHYGSRLPHEGKGRQRRFRPEAVEVFKELRARSSRALGRGQGGRRARAVVGAEAGLARRLRSLERSEAQLARQVKGLIRQLHTPLRATFVHRLEL